MAARTKTILGVNTPFWSLTYPGFSNVHFRSDTSFLDYDAVLISTNCLAEKYHADRPETFQGKRNLSEDESCLIRMEFARTKTQITESLKQGKNIFILMGKNENCFVHASQTSFSGTGRYARPTYSVAEFDVFSFLPMDLKPVMVRGTAFEITCSPPFAPFFHATKDITYYEAYFMTPKHCALLTIPNSDKVISAVFECAKGNIVLLPSVCDRTYFDDEKEWTKYGRKYLKALFELNHALMAGVDSYTLPLWADKVKILDEEAQETKLKEATQKLEVIKAEIEKQKALIGKIRRKKALITASGTPLEEVVKETLHEIGFTLHKAETGRSDVIASYEGTDVVAEIKGVTKSAAEKHAAQLEKWVSEFIEENERKPKAILFVNGYCDTPLPDRTEAVFPDQMLDFSVSRKHALVTTTQLLCLYIEIKNNPACVKERISELLSCTGIYPRYADYGKYLRLIKQDEDETDE